MREPIIDYESLAHYAYDDAHENGLRDGSIFDPLHDWFREGLHKSMNATWEAVNRLPRYPELCRWLVRHHVTGADRIRLLIKAYAAIAEDNPLDLGEYGDPFNTAEAVAAFILDGENFTTEYVNARRWIEAWTFGKVYGGENGHLNAIIKTPVFKAWAGRYQYRVATSPGISFALARQVLEAAAVILKGNTDALID